MMNKIYVTVNHKPVELDITPSMRLLDVIRNQLSLTGTKEGCGEGECGACAVLIDNELVNSCLVPLANVHNKDVLTAK